MAVDIDVPLAPGVQVTVFVIESPNGVGADFLAASQSSIEFWGNPLDDEDWK
jgi:hypothetical protein